MAWWNPTIKEGENPFERFDSWGDFIEHFATFENEIFSVGGPYEEIGEGEWYLTKDTDFGNDWYISYVYNDPNIYYMVIRDNDTTFSVNHPSRWYWDRGDKNGWGYSEYHYRVDFDDKKFSFINWVSINPFSSIK